MEVLVSLALLGLAIVLLSKLSSEYSRVISFSAKKDQVLVAGLALESVAQAIKQSPEILAPAIPSTGSASLTIQVLETNSNARLTQWPNIPAALLKRRTFILEDDQLRAVEEDGTFSVLCAEAVGFSVTREHEHSVTLELTTREQAKLTLTRLEVAQWVK